MIGPPIPNTSWTPPKKPTRVKPPTPRQIADRLVEAYLEDYGGAESGFTVTVRERDLARNIAREIAKAGKVRR